MDLTLLHCIPSLNSGGAERQLTYLCQGLVLKDWSVHVAFMRSGPYYERLQRAGAALYPLTDHLNHDPRLAWRLYSLIRTIKPNVIQTWMPQMDIIGGGMARMLRIPWVLSERSAQLAYPRSLRHYLRSQMAKGASAIISNSAGGAHYWRPRVPSAVVQAVIPNSVPLADIDEAVPALPASVGQHPAQKLILCAGRLSAEKNQVRLVEALRYLPGDISAVLCGEGPERASICRYAEEHSLPDRVIVVANLPSVWGLMKRVHVFVSLSLFEGHPNAVLEAMACRCPLIVSDIAAHREFLDEQAALLIDPRDPQAVATAVREVLAGGSDVARRVEEARARVESLTLGRLCDAYDHLYQNLVFRRTSDANGKSALSAGDSQRR